MNENTCLLMSFFHFSPTNLSKLIPHSQSVILKCVHPCNYSIWKRRYLLLYYSGKGLTVVILYATFKITPIKIIFLYLSRDLVEGVGLRFFNLSLFLFFIDLRTLIPPRIWTWSSSSCGSSFLGDVVSSLLEEGSSSPRLRGDRVSLTRDPGKLKLSSLVVALNNFKFRIQRR